MPRKRAQQVRRCWLVLGSALLVVTIAAFASCRRERGESLVVGGEGFNVLLVTLDTTRVDCLGCYGHPTIQTPNLDALAREGVLFSQCSTCAPVTLPAHASILTGTYPFAHGSRQNGDTIRREGHVFLAELLAERGYTTGAEVAAYVVNREWGLTPGFQTYGDLPATRESGDRFERLEDFNSVPADAVCDRALAWLSAHGRSRFFLWVHFFDPHVPWAPPKRFRTQYADLYLGEIAFMDEQVGRLLDHLKTAGLQHKTLVVVVGDHGEGRGQHGELTHTYFVYDSTMHVPLILNCPGRLPAGRRVQAQTRTVDIAPTILDFVGADPKPDAQGVSLLPMIAAEKQDLGLAAYGETMTSHLTMGYAQLRCLRVGDWKYIHAPTPELYNIKQDPAERWNLAAAQPELAKSMRDQITDLLNDAAERSGASSSNPALTAEAVERLASLGYVSAGPRTDDGATEVEQFLKLTGPDPKDRIENHNEYLKALALLGAGQSEEGEQILRSLTEAEPDNFGYRISLAGHLRDSGRPEDAVGLYEEAIALRPDRTMTHFNMGRSLGELGRFEEAAQHFRLVAEQMPDYATAFKNLGLTLSHLGRPDEAAAAYQRARELEPDDGKVRAALAAVMWSRGSYAEAAEVLREGLRRDTKNISLANNLAWYLATCPDAGFRNGQRAVELAEGVCRRAGEENPQLLDTLAAAYAAAGRFEEAVETARQALELARTTGTPESAEGIAKRLATYQAHEPYTEPGADPVE